MLHKLPSYKKTYHSSAIILLNQYVSDLHLMDPYRPLTRGYSILTMDDKIVRSIQEVQQEDLLQARLMDGALTVQVKERNLDDGA